MAKTTVKTKKKKISASAVKKSAANKLGRRAKQTAMIGSSLASRNFELATGSLRRLLLDLREEFSS